MIVPICLTIICVCLILVVILSKKVYDEQDDLDHSDF
jgi:hypothetical protein